MKKTQIYTAVTVVLLAALTFTTTFCALSLTIFATGTNGGIVGDVTGAIESVVDDVTSVIDDAVGDMTGGAGHVGEGDGDLDGDGVIEGTSAPSATNPATSSPETSGAETTVLDEGGSSMGIIGAIIAIVVVVAIILVVVAVMPKKR